MTGVQSPGGDDGHSDECDAVGGDELGVVRKAGFGTAILKSRNGRDGPWRKCFSTVYEIEDFHIHTSILLDRIVGIYEPYFGEKNAVVSGNHEAFLKNLKHRPDINYLPATLITGAKWLQDNVDWYRNRLIIHPAGYEKNGFHTRGVKSRGKENLRTFARARLEVGGQMKEIDKEKYCPHSMNARQGSSAIGLLLVTTLVNERLRPVSDVG